MMRMSYITLGKNYGKFIDGICQDIGYCPQYDCIQGKLTLEDYLNTLISLKRSSTELLTQFVKKY